MFWYLQGMGYGLHVISGPVVGISILNRLILPTSVKYNAAKFFFQ